MSQLDRRHFLAATGAGLAAGAVGRRSAAAEGSQSTFEMESMFEMGVASGDPTPDSVVLWTRVAPFPARPDFGMGDAPDEMVVHWRIATSREAVHDDSTSLYAGDVTAQRAYAWSVHVDVIDADGGGPLNPDTTYFYQFSLTGDSDSRRGVVGRTRTAAAADTTSAVTFAVMSCQNMSGRKDGSPARLYFRGIDHLLARRDEPDFILYLGDYIYDLKGPFHRPTGLCTELVHYRQRYGRYRTVPELRHLHGRYPIFVVPDDHEIYNDVFGGDVPPAQLDRYNNAMQAFWENMPVRGGPPEIVDGKARLTFHRRIRWGAHLDFLMTDIRQYRTAKTTLGPEQRTWLLESIASSATAWTVISTGVPMMFVPDFDGADDKWMGYESDRSAVTDALAARLDLGGFNPVVLSGDTHCGAVAGVRRRQNTRSRLVATEFVGPPMTSNSTKNWVQLRTGDPAAIRRVYSRNPAGTPQSLKGYLHCRVTADAWTSEYFMCDDATVQDAPVTSRGRWTVTPGVVGARPASERPIR